MPDSSLPSSPAKPLRVLYVEDHATLRGLMSEFMQRAGYIVETANDGHEGWRKFEATSFDLLITDLQMPILDGIQFIRRVRESKRPVRIIVYSSAAAEPNLTKLRQLAVDEVVPKEASWLVLHSKIRALMRPNS